MKKYLCINCKAEFDEMPPMEPNECIAGYHHDFVLAEHIIKRDFPPGYGWRAST